MRILIKIFLVLVVILGSVSLGYYQAGEKYFNQIKALKDELVTRQILITRMKDSINIMNREINQIKLNLTDVSKQRKNKSKNR